MKISVPVAAMIAVLVGFAVKKYKGSSCYTADRRTMPQLTQFKSAPGDVRHGNNYY